LDFSLIQLQNVFKTAFGTLDRTLRLEKARFVVQRQNQAVDLKQNLLRIGIWIDVPIGLRSAHCAVHGSQPSIHRERNCIAHRAGPVVKLYGATDVDAARVDLE
jgi:hypothetical protein